MVTSDCESCGARFTRTKARRYCSKRCRAVHYHQTHARATEKGCDVCGARFVVPISMSAQRFCSRACYRRRALKHSRTFACRQCGAVVARGLRGARATFCSVRCRSESYRSGGYVSQQGYRVISVDGVPALEHRYVMEKVIGRALRRSESVHHRDGDRLNNDPGNLELWHRGQPAGQRLTEKLARAIAFVVEHGYTVTPPAVAGS